MSKVLKKLMLLMAFLTFAGLAFPVQAQDKAPDKLQAALIMKLLAFYTNLGADPFTIHVIGAPGLLDQADVSGVQVAHGRHKTDTLTRPALGVQ